MQDQSQAPRLGDVARSKDVGVGNSYHKVMWCACVDCGAERWVLLRNGRPQSLRCYPCGRIHVGNIRKANPWRGKDHPRWKGGRSVMTNGYIEVWMNPEDPLFQMAGKDGYAYEHRVVMARALGRALVTAEEVHHKNGDKHDNSIDNLVLMSKSDHASEPYAEIVRLRQRVAELEHELASLKAQTS